MPKVKLTKTALKQERDSLKQFQRFLPTLQLKKQQLQLEMGHSTAQLLFSRYLNMGFITKKSAYYLSYSIGNKATRKGKR